ncbi:hypothetical protein Q3G72_019592 [Acer saccharum]|nr:hypothetical protein Q3G72_019592 [Acer saccharum]
MLRIACKILNSGYDIESLFQEARSRWLKPAEVHFILQNHEKYQLNQEAPQKPSGGSVFLFNKRVLRFFRKDGHNWCKKKDGRAVGEAHEILKHPAAIYVCDAKTCIDEKIERAKSHEILS